MTPVILKLLATKSGFHLQAGLLKRKALCASSVKAVPRHFLSTGGGRGFKGSLWRGGWDTTPWANLSFTRKGGLQLQQQCPHKVPVTDMWQGLSVCLKPPLNWNYRLVEQPRKAQGSVIPSWQDVFHVVMVVNTKHQSACCIMPAFINT